MSAIYNFLLENHLLATIEQAISARKSTLNLSSFEIKTLPEILFDCQDVLRLYLHKNKMTNIDRKIMNLSALTTLTLDYNNLSTLPPEIGLLTSLINLNLSHNPLKWLLPEIGNLINLEVLWCNKTDIDTIPNEICKLVNLDTFGARDNRITLIPQALLTLTDLRWLTLVNNSIKELPSNIDSLESLIHLNLKGNLISSIPLTIYKCQDMRFLLLTDNRISELPVGWENLKSDSLKIMDLRGNPVAENATWLRLTQSHPVIRMTEEWPKRNATLVDDSTNHELAITPSASMDVATPTETEICPPHPAVGMTEERPNGNPETPDLTLVGNSTNHEFAIAPSTSLNVATSVETEWTEGEIDDAASVSTDSSEDWENSVLSSDLDMSDSSYEDRQDNEIVAVILPDLSRFASTGS